MARALPIDRLVDDLAQLGIARSDVVMVHASLRAIGPVEGGAAGVIDALDRAVGSEGTVLMVLGARDDWAWVNERAESERVALLAAAEPFDSVCTPADPDVGMLAEVCRRSPGTVVNNHPEGRFGARGRLANDLLIDAPWDDYYGPGSPLERLVDAGGKVLRLGADPDTVTLLHYAEYLAPVANKRRVRRHRLVTEPSKPEIRTIESLDDSRGIVDHPGEDYFVTILNAYLAAGHGRRGTVGAASSEILDARDFVEYATTWMGEYLFAGDLRQRRPGLAVRAAARMARGIAGLDLSSLGPPAPAHTARSFPIVSGDRTSKTPKIAGRDGRFRAGMIRTRDEPFRSSSRPRACPPGMLPVRLVQQGREMRRLGTRRREP